jgi:hypothetical protein
MTESKKRHLGLWFVAGLALVAVVLKRNRGEDTSRRATRPAQHHTDQVSGR